MSRVAWWLSTLAYLACWGLVLVAAHAGLAPSLVALGVALAFVPYAVLLAGLQCGTLVTLEPEAQVRARARSRALGLGLALGVLLLSAPPRLSDDLYRYVWDGRVLAAGLDPYAYAPHAPARAELRDASWAHINHPELPTIYPPLAIAAFALLSGLGTLGPKLLGLLGLALLVHATATLAPLRRVAQATYGAALNPLLLAEGPLHGHVDVLAAGCLLAALAALARLPGAFAGGARAASPEGSLAHRVRAERDALVRVFVLATLAVGTKLVGLLLLPVFAAARDRRVRALVPALLVAGALMIAPLTWAGYAERDASSGLSHYARRWRGNEGAYALVERGIERALVESHGGRWEKLELDPEPAWLALLARIGVDPRDGLVGDKKEAPSRVLVLPSVLAAPLARASVALLLLLVAASVVRWPTEPVLALRRLAFAGLLLAPQLHPWYLALLVPLELVSGRVAGHAFAVAIYLAYAPLDGWVSARVWDVDMLPTWLMHGLVWLLLLVELGAEFARRTRSGARED